MCTKVYIHVGKVFYALVGVADGAQRHDDAAEGVDERQPEDGPHLAELRV